MKLRIRDVMSIVMVVVSLACVILGFEMHRHDYVLMSMVVVLGILWLYYWGPRRGDGYLLWIGGAIVEADVSVVLAIEGLDIVAYLVMATAIITMIVAIVVKRKETGYYPFMELFSNKGLPKR